MAVIGQFVVHRTGKDAIVSKIMNGISVGAGFGSGAHLRHVIVDRSLTGGTFASAGTVCSARQATCAGKAEKIALRELAEDPYVMFEGPSSRRYFKQMLRSQRIRPDTTFYAASMESVRSVVANGFGYSLAVMPMTQADTYGGGQVVRIALSDDIEPLSVVLISKDTSCESALVEYFIAFCKSKSMH